MAADYDSIGLLRAARNVWGLNRPSYLTLQITSTAPCLPKPRLTRKGYVLSNLLARSSQGVRP